MRRFIALFILACSAGTIATAVSYPLGERLCYRILWGMIPVGRAIISCEEVSENSTRLIRIRVEAKSNRVVSALYPVNDRVDSFIDPKSGLPVRVEKQTQEGGYVCDDTLRFDRENLTAYWQSRSASIETNYSICSNTLDVAAFLYALRSERFKPGSSKTFQIAADGFLHGLTIQAEESKLIDTDLRKEKIRCMRFSATPDREDLFVRKVPGDIWVTDDSMRIMIKMKTKIPIGHVSVVFDAEESILTAQ